MADQVEGFVWRLRPPSRLPGDDIDLALSVDAAELTFGPYLFAFARMSLPGDGLLLSLAPVGMVDEESGEVTSGSDLPEGCARDEIIPAPQGDFDAATRERLATRYLLVLGRALFDDVARAVSAARSVAHRPGVTSWRAVTAPEHEAWVDLVCPACGETTASPVRLARRSSAVRCRHCGATIDLTGEEVQRELDRAEREWQEANARGPGSGDRP